jgi:hypothetical protein
MTGSAQHPNDSRRNDYLECVDEIIENLLRTERKYLVSPKYIFTVQKSINVNMRGMAIDWLVEVADEFSFSAQTLHLSTNYLDRYLSSVPVSQHKLQLVAISCMLIASKYEERCSPPVEKFVQITDNTYKTDEVPR